MNREDASLDWDDDLETPEEIESDQWSRYIKKYVPTPEDRIPEFYNLKLPGDKGTLQFEWDEEKNRINIAEHHVPFTLAMLVFADENLLIAYDEKHSAKEDRWNAIGCVDVKGRHKFFFVVYAERYYKDAGLAYRLISARRAKESEVDIYYDQDR